MNVDDAMTSGATGSSSMSTTPLHRLLFDDGSDINMTQRMNETSDVITSVWPAIDAIDRFVTPTWYIIGIPGNVVAYVVWIQRRMRPSSGCYLAALALDECLFLILQMLYELETRWEVTLLQLPGLCEIFPILFLTTQYLSPLLVLGFTVERYISVCHPFRREHYCTTRRAVATITALIFMSLALHAVQGYFWKFYPSTSTSSMATDEDRAAVDDRASDELFSAFVGECRIRPEVMAAGMWSVWSVWSWVTEMAVFGVVPLTILSLNILVIRETRLLSANDVRIRSLKVKTTQADVTNRAAGEFQKQMSGHRGNGSGRSATAVNGSSSSSSAISATFRPSATTVMLLAVSFYLIATTLPVTICYVLYLRFPEGDHSVPASNGGEARWSDPTWSRHYIYRGVRTVVEEFGMSHYACNLYIYLVTGRIFRRELRQLIGRRVPSSSGSMTDRPGWPSAASRDARRAAAFCGRGYAMTTQRPEEQATRLNRGDMVNENNLQRQQQQQQQQQQLSVTVSGSSTCHGRLLAMTSCINDASNSCSAAGVQLLRSDKTFEWSLI